MECVLFDLLHFGLCSPCQDSFLNNDRLAVQYALVITSYSQLVGLFAVCAGGGDLLKKASTMHSFIYLPSNMWAILFLCAINVIDFIIAHFVAVSMKMKIPIYNLTIVAK